jgi:hypothetical protein
MILTRNICRLPNARERRKLKAAWKEKKAWELTRKVAAGDTLKANDVCANRPLGHE